MFSLYIIIYMCLTSVYEVNSLGNWVPHSQSPLTLFLCVSHVCGVGVWCMQVNM